MRKAFRSDLPWSAVTPRADFLNRRQLIAGLGAGGLAGGLGLMPRPTQAAGLTYSPSSLSTSEAPNSREDITTYNNFYEFGTGKDDPSRNSAGFKPRPWEVAIEGLVERPGNWSLDDILKGQPLEERIYRLRCVEAWSMVIPWIGFPLADLLQRAGLQPGAKYVAFETLLRPSEMVGQNRRFIDWPYREGLRLDEALHPLTILATGLYGEELPNANGAPIRLVVPWKYGFKSIKSVVRIRVTDQQPENSWRSLQPQEYGFYANVNPAVDHPRWSQASERRIGGGLFAGRIATQPFNGYADQVAGLYAGMDLAVNY